MNTKRKRLTTKIALTAGVLLLIVWSVLGTGASLAWFQDETPVVKNIFSFSEFDLAVSYKNSTMTDYAPMEIDSAVFDENALYEPGYTQIVHLKIKNNGTADMRYKLSVDVRSVTTAMGVLGNEIYLPNYLKYGVLFSDSEASLTRSLAQTEATEEMARLTLNSFSQWDSVTLSPGQERYIALIVCMPEEVGNAANHRGDTPPTVEMGLTVYAEQAEK